jgi:hypothetical protein
VAVFRTTDQFEFAIVKSALETAGIPFVAQGEFGLRQEPGAPALYAAILVPMTSPLKTEPERG